MMAVLSDKNYNSALDKIDKYDAAKTVRLHLHLLYYSFLQLVNSENPTKPDSKPMNNDDIMCPSHTVARQK